MSKSLKKLIDINRLREFKNKLVGTDSAYVQTTAVDQTIAGTKTFSEPIVGSVTGSSGSCTGNAATATTAATAEACTGNAATATRANSAANADTATNATNSNAANQLQAFVNDDFTGGNHYVKAIRSSLGWSTHLWMCYNNGAKMADEVSVNYANSAGSATKLTQWYAAYPDGAEAHNAMWGGRDITAAFNNGTVSANIANGTFRDIFPGDYITKQVTVWNTTYTVNWVIADCDYWINKGDQGGMTAHHVAIVPQVPIFSYHMNPTNTTEGGYAGSDMYRNVIPPCATGIVNAFGADHILTFRDHVSVGVDTSHVSSGLPQVMGTPTWWGSWVSAQCSLMSEKMVYGAPICAAGAVDNVMATRQMSAFRLSERLINCRWWWWLRDVVFSQAFALVYSTGDAHAEFSSGSRGVRPFALLR